MKFAPVRLPLFAALFVVSACAPTTLPPEEGEHRAAVAHLKQAAAKSLTAEQRAVLYLESAQEASALLDSRSSGEAARVIYNKAAADLVVLLRSAKNGSLWNRPLTLTSGSGNYRLRFAKATRDGIWDPAYFTSFTQASEVDLKTIERRDRQDGIGGALVGVRKTDPLEAFSPRVGVTAPVTAVLDFKGKRCDPLADRSHGENPRPASPARTVRWTPISPRRSPITRSNPSCGKV